MIKVNKIGTYLIMKNINVLILFIYKIIYIKNQSNI